ncbi:Arylsulfatase [Planctomycetes bacterium Poly30]|uniref:Arylsulfatase n=1 Tax=Saltatorellus ferox TaxID=2528018 RepID=A0A518EMD1_9BACT|nr:Arylsulfatase [Planctomycetes bacterium Poly30]
MWISSLLALASVLGAPQVEASAAAQIEASTAEPARPNILLILTDDQRVDTIGSWGNQHIATPNIDRLVNAGTSFRRNYCMGSPHGAVCAPSRAMIHSGRAYHSIDHSALRDVELLGETLRARGYRTYGVGKWHNGQESFKRSFDEGRAVLFSGMSNHFDVPLHDVGADGSVETREPSTEHSSDLFSAAAISFLEDAGQSEPFFLSLALTAPHDPRDPPAEYRERELPELPANFKPQHPFDNGHLTLRDENLAAWPRDTATVRRQLGDYYGLVEHMDAAIGRVLDALEARTDGRETVIVFASDHGLALGSHGLLGKQSVYEHSLRAPLVIVGPGVPAGQHVTALTYLLDIHPTLLGFAGPLPEPEPEEAEEAEAAEETGVEDENETVEEAPELPLEGSDLGHVSRDLAPIWRGERAEVRESIYLALGRTQRAVTDGRWKLSVYPAIGHRQLFDLATDPDELIDLAGRLPFQHHIDRLMIDLERWRERIGDPDPLTVGELKPFHVDLTGRARKPDRWQPQWIRETFFDPQPEEPAVPAVPEPPAEAEAAKEPKK